MLGFSRYIGEAWMPNRVHISSCYHTLFFFSHKIYMLHLEHCRFKKKKSKRSLCGFPRNWISVPLGPAPTCYGLGLRAPSRPRSRSETNATHDSHPLYPRLVRVDDSLCLAWLVRRLLSPIAMVQAASTSSRFLRTTRLHGSSTSTTPAEPAASA